MKKKKENTTSSTIAEGLRNEINFGKLKPGDKILEREIADRYKVSHIPVREALKILEGEGFLMYEKFAGYHVREISTEEMLELFNIMRFLLNQLLVKAIPRYTEITFYQVKALVKEMDETKDPVVLVSQLLQYFDIILSPAGLNYTYNLASQFLRRNIPIIQGMMKEVYHYRIPAEAFTDFVDICEKGDNDKALKYAMDIYERTTKAFVAYISEAKRKKKHNKVDVKAQPGQ